MGASTSTWNVSCQCSACNSAAEAVEAVTVEERMGASESARHTSSVAEFPVYCLEMQNFLKLELMQKHEDVFDQLQQPTDDTIVHFISHEWLGFQHPDPDGTQLKRMHAVLSVFLAGQAHSFFDDGDWDAFLKGTSAGTGRNFLSLESQLGGRDIRTGDDIVEHVQAGVVWLDYHSIPQTRKDEVFIKAVNGIPHYVERCDYFWVCAPTAMHKELQQPRNFQTWRNRGWCRLEDTINMLSRNLKMPLIVTNQPHVSTYGLFDGIIPYFGRPERSIFNGNFTCCQRNHEIQQADGSLKRIECDKLALGPVLRRSFESFLAKPSGPTMFKVNFVCTIGRTLFAGHPHNEEAQSAPDPEEETLEAALRRLGYASLEDTDELGWCALGPLASLADFRLVLEAKNAKPELLDSLALGGWTLLMRSVHFHVDKFIRILEMYPEDKRLAAVKASSEVGGHTALDRAAKYGFCDNVLVLLQAKADIGVKRKDNGATPLLSAADFRYPQCCRVLLEHRADIAAVDNKGLTALHLAVDPLALLGNTAPGSTLEVIQLLLEARASPCTMDNKGRTPLDLAMELHLEEEQGLGLLRSFSQNKV